MGWKLCVLLYLLTNIFNSREPYHQDLSWSKLQVELDLDIAKEWVSGQLPLFILEIYLVKLGAPWRPISACFVPAPLTPKASAPLVWNVELLFHPKVAEIQNLRLSSDSSIAAPVE